MAQLHVKVVRDRWGSEHIVLHRGLDNVVAMLMSVEWDKLLADLAEQRETFETRRPKKKR